MTRESGFSVRLLGPGDEGVLASVADEVFDDPVDPALAREFVSDPRHHIAVAVEAGVVIGFASGVHYLHPDKPAQLWINEVGVSPAHQGRGVGKAVLQTLLAAARDKGCGVAWVLTDQSNTAARALYASVGGEAGADPAQEGEQILGFNFDLSGPAS
jgi:ribosomal protein S18 acetylase RimI-like enzyme